jgi:hypothetical protein
MPKLLTGVAALALLGAAALPVAAVEREQDGIRNSAEGPSEFSARRRVYRQRYVIRRAYAPRRYAVQQTYPGYYGSPYWGSSHYAGYPYGPYAGPGFGVGFGSGYYGPGFSLGFGFGPRWGW